MSVLGGRASAVSLLGLTSFEVQLSWQPDTEGTPVSSDPVRLYLALDNSGSMSGTAISCAKEAVMAFLGQVAVPSNPFNLESIHLLVFNNEVEIVFNVELSKSLKGLTQDAIAKVVDGIYAGGGTNFRAVLRSLQDLAMLAPERDNHVVIFFTDGEDTSFSGPWEVKEALADFKSSFASRSSALQMHCLGFGRSHDAAFLSELTLAGSDPGSFQYISDVSGQLMGALERVTVEMEAYSGTSKRLRVNLQLGGVGGGATLPLSLWLQQPPCSPGEGPSALREPLEGPLEGPPLGEVQVFVGKAACEACTAEALAQHATVEVEVQGAGPGGRVHLPVAKREVGLQEGGGLGLEVVKQQVIRWTNQIANQQLDPQGLSAVRDRVLAIRRDLAGMQARAKELLPLGRDVYRSVKGCLLEAATLAGRFEGEIVAAALAGSLTNHAVASLNDLAYRSVSKAGLRRGLDKRVGANVAMMEGLQEKIQGVVDGIKGQLEGLPEGEEFGACAISCCTYKEALQAGDCLCLGLDIERPEAAIMDPSRLKVKAITPTRITAESFMDALSLALGGSRTAEQVHGGFGRGAQAQVVVGEGREAITGALPLYISPQHWAVARLQAKPLLGWMCTLNPLGFSDEQLRTVPFLVLGRALHDLFEGGENGSGAQGGRPSEFRTWVAEQVLQTCLVVYRSRRRRILTDLAVPPPAQAASKWGFQQSTEADFVAAQYPSEALHGVWEGSSTEAMEVEQAAAGVEERVAGESGAAGLPELPELPLRGAQLSYLAGGPAARTMDAVPSTGVWLLRLLCAVACGDVALTPEDCRALRLAVLEEEMRRCLPEPEDKHQHAASLLCIHPSHECELATARWLRGAQEGVAAAAEGEGEGAPAASGATLDASTPLGDDSKGMVGALEGIVKSMAGCRDWAGQLWPIGEGAEAQRAQRTYTAQARPTLQLLARLEQVAAAAAAAAAAGGGAGSSRSCREAAPASLAAASSALAPLDWGPPALLLEWEWELPGGRHSLAAMLLQNAAGVRNADRRAYIAEGKYVDPFVAPQALLERAYVQVMTARVRASANAIRDARQRAAAEKRAARFASAPSVEGAAGALAGWRLGARFELAALLAALHAPGVALLQEKMGLLMMVCLEGDSSEGGPRPLRADRSGPRPGSKRAARARARAERAERKRQREVMDGTEPEGNEEMEVEGGIPAVEAASAAAPASPAATASRPPVEAVAAGNEATAEAAQRAAAVSGWVPSRQRVFSFLRAHQSEVGVQEALALLGRCRGVDEEYLRFQYATGFAVRRPPGSASLRRMRE